MVKGSSILVYLIDKQLASFHRVEGEEGDKLIESRSCICPAIPIQEDIEAGRQIGAGKCGSAVGLR